MQKVIKRECLVEDVLEHIEWPYKYRLSSRQKNDNAPFHKAYIRWWVYNRPNGWNLYNIVKDHDMKKELQYLFEMGIDKHDKWKRYSKAIMFHTGNRSHCECKYE